MAQGTLAHKIGDVVFVHGAVIKESLGVVPTKIYTLFGLEVTPVNLICAFPFFKITTFTLRWTLIFGWSQGCQM